MRRTDRYSDTDIARHHRIVATRERLRADNAELAERTALAELVHHRIRPKRKDRTANFRRAA